MSLDAARCRLLQEGGGDAAGVEGGGGLAAWKLLTEEASRFDEWQAALRLPVTPCEEARSLAASMDALFAPLLAPLSLRRAPFQPPGI